MREQIINGINRILTWPFCDAAGSLIKRVFLNVVFSRLIILLVPVLITTFSYIFSKGLYCPTPTPAEFGQIAEVDPNKLVELLDPKIASFGDSHKSWHYDLEIYQDCMMERSFPHFDDGKMAKVHSYCQLKSVISKGGSTP